MKKIFLALLALTVNTTYGAAEKKTSKEELIAAAQYIVDQEFKARKNKDTNSSSFRQNQESLTNILKQLNPKEHISIAGLIRFQELNPRPATPTNPTKKSRNRKRSTLTPSPTSDKPASSKTKFAE